MLTTGGGTGLSKSVGRRFLELGAALAICGRRADVLAATAREHVRRPAARSRPLDAVEAVLGQLFVEPPLAALVNNAAGNFLARREELSPRAIDAVVGSVRKGSRMAPNLRPPLAGRGHAGTVPSITTTYA